MDKTRYLLRHAKSAWDDPTLADHDHPLAPRGRRASKVIAEYLRRQPITPMLVLCSSSARTRETFKRISAGLRGGVELRIEERLYTASAAGLLERLHEVPVRVDAVMLIGHYPALQELAVRLASRGVDLGGSRRSSPPRHSRRWHFTAAGMGWRPELPSSSPSSRPRSSRSRDRVECLLQTEAGV